MARLVAAAAFLAIGAFALAASVAGPTHALFTDTQSVGGNTFTADTLDPPTSPSAAAGATAGTIDLAWTASVDSYASGYRILRSTTQGGPYSQVAEVTPVSATSYQDTGLTSSTTYYYVIRTFHENWESVNSTEVSATAP